MDTQTLATKPRRKTVGEDNNVGVRITAIVATDTQLPLRWKEREDGTFVLEFRTDSGWREVPLIEG